MAEAKHNRLAHSSAERLLALLLSSMITIPAAAHHSFVAIYEMGRTIQITGVVESVS